MKKFSILTLALSVSLIGCTAPTEKVTIEQLMENPLFAERYSDEMVGVLTDFEIKKDPIMEDKSMAKYITDLKVKWLKEAKKATNAQNEGRNGHFITMKQYTSGEVLFTYPKLYIDSVFETEPGPELHLYLTTVVDPREVEFPDETSIDFGVIPPYGAQTFIVPEIEEPILYRTAVLWDTKLERLYGFAQLSER